MELQVLFNIVIDALESIGWKLAKRNPLSIFFSTNKKDVYFGLYNPKPYDKLQVEYICKKHNPAFGKKLEDLGVITINGKPFEYMATFNANKNIGDHKIFAKLDIREPNIADDAIKTLISLRKEIELNGK